LITNLSETEYTEIRTLRTLRTYRNNLLIAKENVCIKTSRYLMQFGMCVERKSGKKQENSDIVVSDIFLEIKIHLRIETLCSSET